MIKKFVEKITYTNCACHDSHCTCLEDEVRDYSYEQVGYQVKFLGFEFYIEPSFLTRNYTQSESYFSSTWGVSRREDEITNVKINDMTPLRSKDDRLTKWLSK